MPTLHFGVIDFPHTGVGKTPLSTGDLAEILEAKYHVMAHFAEMHGDDIAKALEVGLEGVLTNMLLGGPAPANAFDGGTSAIDDKFRHFLDMKEMDALGYPGIPTEASLLGVSSRFKKRRGPPRPSFVDSSQYQSAFKSWVDQ